MSSGASGERDRLESADAESAVSEELALLLVTASLSLSVGGPGTVESASSSSISTSRCAPAGSSASTPELFSWSPVASDMGASQRPIDFGKSALRREQQRQSEEHSISPRAKRERERESSGPSTVFAGERTTSSSQALNICELSRVSRDACT